MAARRRDYSKIAENTVLLGAQVAGLSVPMGPALGLWRAVRGEGMAGADKKFVERLLIQIDTWCRQHAGDVAAIGGLPSGWPERLIDRLGATPPAGGSAAARLIAETIFSTPLIDEGRGRVDAMAGRLAAAMPELIVEAGDPYGVFGALRAVFAGDLASLEAELAARLNRLDPDLPPEAAVVLVAGYLARLIDRLDRDTWSARERDDNSPRVSLTGIQQHLSVRTEKDRNGEPVPVGDLAASCDRLVILGGPGAGKTWAARRIAIHAAEVALERIDSGTPPDEVELPLFARCADVLKKNVSSRRGELVDAGLGSADDDAPGDRPRLTQILRRHPRLLAVLDGLDETADLDVDALYALMSPHVVGRARLVVTTRPGSWNSGLLHLEPDNDRHQLGDLQPFTHGDVRRAVEGWLDDDPASRDQLLDRIGDANSTLSQQARVPLLCAMFCVAARPDPHVDENGDAPDVFQPGRRIELYDTVIDRLVRATWRGITLAPAGGRDIDDVIADATGWLEDLASEGNVDDPTTSLSSWLDTVQPRRPLPDGAGPYVDHVAPPVRGAAGIGRRARRFVHRRLREHLAAKALCRQPAADIADRLLRHLWFDPTWADVVPTVIAAHPQADQLVAHLVREAHTVVPQDPTFALDETLVKAAALTQPRPDSAGQRDAAIQRAIRATLERTDPKRWGKYLAGTGDWPVTDTARDRLLDLLDSPDLKPDEARQLADTLVALAPTAPQAQRGAERVVDLLDSTSPDWLVGSGLARALAALTQNLSDSHVLVERILDLLITSTRDRFATDSLSETLAALLKTVPDRHDVVERVFDLLDAPDLDPVTVGSLAKAMASLTDDKRRVRSLLRRRLDEGDGGYAAEVARTLGWLDPTVADKRLVFDALLSWIRSDGDSDDWIDVAVKLIWAASTPEEHAQVVALVLDRVQVESDNWSLSYFVQAVVPRLDLTPDAKASIRVQLLDALEGEVKLSDALFLVQELVGLDTTPSDKARARAALLGILTERLNDLSEPIDDRTWSRSPGDFGASVGSRLADLNATPEECASVRATLLDWLAHEPDGGVAEELIAALQLLPASVDDKRRVRSAFLERLTPATDETLVPALIAGLETLSPTVEDTDHIRSVMLTHLKRDNSDLVDLEARYEIAGLDLTDANRLDLRAVIVSRLSSEADESIAGELVECLSLLGPAPDDLLEAESWAARPSDSLLRAVRHNCTLHSWLNLLQHLAWLGQERSQPATCDS